MMRKIITIVAKILFFNFTAFAANTTLNVFDSADLVNPIGQIQTIATAQTGAQHYSYSSSSGHPANVNLGTYNSNVWVHENTNTGEYSFGFIFSKDNSGDSSNDADFRFRIVDSQTNVYVSQSDDPGEAIEIAPGVFEGTFWYGNNTDGICVSGITGSSWTIIIDSVDFGDVTNWYASSGELAGFTDDLSLTLGNEYRITPLGKPSDDSVTVPVPGSLLLGGIGIACVRYINRRRSLKITSKSDR